MSDLPSDADLVRAAAATYLPNNEPLFEDLDHSVRIFATRTPDAKFAILSVEGTHDELGWGIDFAAAAVEDQQGMNHQTLGFIHAGFYLSSLAALARCAIFAADNRPYAICGHSLGAGLAGLIAAELSQDALAGRSLSPVKIAMFAPPRVGGRQYVDALSKIPFSAYRYGDDPVTQVPIHTARFPYEQVPLTQIGPASNVRFPLFGDVAGLVRGNHHIQNYVSGVLARGIAAES